MQSLLEQFIPITLANLHREYPNVLLHYFNGDGELLPPRQLHPAFYGCLDWHSSVHSHWQVVRAIHLFPDAAFVPAAIATLDRSFTIETITGELAYLQPRRSFEMPYGIAWLLQLTAELRQHATPHAQRWLALLTPLEQLGAKRIAAYFADLVFPIRGGLHNQSAFSMGLVYDWACISGESAMLKLIEQRARHFFAADRDAPLAYEPSAVDFLSPTLAEADLLRRVLGQAEFSEWLWGFFGVDMLEKLPTMLAPVGVVNPSDGQLAHFAGLNISRAWMLEGIASALTIDDPCRAMLLDLANRHREIGRVDAFHEDYMVSHWAPSYALYLLTQRGI